MTPRALGPSARAALPDLGFTPLLRLAPVSGKSGVLHGVGLARIRSLNGGPGRLGAAVRALPAAGRRPLPWGKPAATLRQCQTLC